MRTGREEGVAGGRYSSSSEEVLLDPLGGDDEETVSLRIRYVNDIANT